MDSFYIGLIPEKNAVGLPHEKLPGTDIASVIKVQHGDMIATVSQETLQRLYMTEEEGFELAQKNTDRESYTFAPMSMVLQGMGISPEYSADMTAPYPGTPMLYVLTNEKGWDGASMITRKDVMDDIRQQLGEDFVVLPSSRHEVIILPESVAPDVKELEAMVREINASVVSPDDFLSDSVFRYDGNSLMKVGEHELEMTSVNTAEMQQERGL